MLHAEELSDGVFWDNWGLFLITVTIKVLSAQHLAISITRQLWDSARIMNMLVVVQEDTLLNLYMWFPYTSYDHCDYVKYVVLINQWIMEEEGSFFRGGLLFSRKIPRNFRGRTVKLSNFDMHGT